MAIAGSAHGEVVTAVAVEVCRRQGRAEGCPGLGGAPDSGSGEVDGSVCGGVETSIRSPEHEDATGGTRAGCSDGQVVATVAIEVAACQCGAERAGGEAG